VALVRKLRARLRRLSQVSAGGKVIERNTYDGYDRIIQRRQLQEGGTRLWSNRLLSATNHAEDLARYIAARPYATSTTRRVESRCRTLAIPQLRRRITEPGDTNPTN
jgi:hypothetical protein